MKSFADIPAGWTVASLDRLVERISGGGTPSKSDPENFSGNIPFMTVKDMKGRFISDTVDHISEKALHSGATTLVPADTLVVATRMSLGKIVRPLMDVAINQDLKALFLKDGIDKTYVEHFWRYSVPVIQEMGTGTTVKGIRLEDVRSLPVPVPPSGEQRRIADKLDRVLAHVAAANEHLSRVGVLLKKFRSAVLEAAISGWLVGNEFELDGFDEVKASELGFFRGADLPLLPESWAWLPFGSVAQVVSDLRDPSGYGDFIHLAPNNIEPWTGVVSGCRTIAEDRVFSPKHVFRAGQIVYSKIRPNLCKVAIPEFSGLCSADMYPIETRLDERYLLLYMLSDRFTGWASNSDSRTILPKINKKDLYSIPVPVPLSLSGQKAIVSKVHALLSIEREVTGALQVTRSQVDELIPSLLAKAFRGDLVPQDFDDEPASELLARLAEANASENQKPIRRKRQTSV